MRYSLSLIATSGLLASVSAHGLVTSIQGANGVTMPGLSVADGTPRDCATNGCGSQADTAIIRTFEIRNGRATPLGRTQGNGPVDAATMIKSFMGQGSAPTNKGAASSVGVEDNIPANLGQKRSILSVRGILDTFGKAVGGLASGAADVAGTAASIPTNLVGGVMGSGGTKSQAKQETSVASMAGQGSASGLPTSSDDGAVTMTYRQINQDGAGPMTAEIDGTSGGTDESAFKRAEVVQNVPGTGISGLSLATNTDYPLTVQMPPGMTCDASVGGADNVCIVRARNNAIAGPFGGSAAFTQSPAARKRALNYRMKMKRQSEQNQNRSLRN